MAASHDVTITRGNYFLKVSIYLFNVFYKPYFFSKKRWFSKTLKVSYIPINSFSLLCPPKYFINQPKSYILIIRKAWSFFNQNFQSVTILDKRLGRIIFIFFINLPFFENTFHWNIPFHSNILIHIIYILQIIWTRKCLARCFIGMHLKFFNKNSQ